MAAAANSSAAASLARNVDSCERVQSREVMSMSRWPGSLSTNTLVELGACHFAHKRICSARLHLDYQQQHRPSCMRTQGAGRGQQGRPALPPLSTGGSLCTSAALAAAGILQLDPPMRTSYSTVSRMKTLLTRSMVASARGQAMVAAFTAWLAYFRRFGPWRPSRTAGSGNE